MGDSPREVIQFFPYNHLAESDFSSRVRPSAESKGKGFRFVLTPKLSWLARLLPYAKYGEGLAGGGFDPDCSATPFDASYWTNFRFHFESTTRYAAKLLLTPQ
jgi:hypothetical protein